MALSIMMIVSMMSPQVVRRLAALGFFAALLALVMLPIFGVDFGKGAVRWYSLGFASVQPSEFLKPVFIVFSAWLIAASGEINGPPRKLFSFLMMLVGVGEGAVKWSLPDAHTDFIIAVAAEEYGLVLVLCIIALFAIFTVRTLYRLMKERDPFIRLAGTGLVAMFAMQATINMGVAVRLLPAKGMTLPFVSNGGSSLIAGGIAVGMLLAFTRTRPQGEMRDILIHRRN
jgi:cell division protein FtsW (lipid II flippase)